LRGQSRAVEWLLGRDQPAVRRLALLDLMGRKDSDDEVEWARADIPKRGWAKEILGRQKPGGRWGPGLDLYRPKYVATNWMLLVLSDLGLTGDDPRVRRAAELVLDEWMKPDPAHNIFKDEVCIVGNTARYLTRFGYGGDPRVQRLFSRLVEDQRANGGWHCREGLDGTIDGWEALAAFAALPPESRGRRVSRAVKEGAEFYLERRLLEEGKRYLPWFRLHYPNHYYYDVLVGLDVLTRLGFGGDSRLGPALGVLMKKRGPDGTWSLDRVHPDPPSYAWGRGNLKRRTQPFSLERPGEPSKWATLTAMRVMKLAGAGSSD
jgi:hypothetical protein